MILACFFRGGKGGVSSKDAHDDSDAGDGKNLPIVDCLSQGLETNSWEPMGIQLMDLMPMILKRLPCSLAQVPSILQMLASSSRTFSC